MIPSIRVLFLRSRFVSAALSALFLFTASSFSPAAVFTYTAVDGANDFWSAGTHWSATPVSSSSTELNFGGGPFKSLNDTNTNDLGAFQLNILDLAASGTSTGNGSSITIASSAGSSLNFVSNGSTTPQVNLTGNAGHGMDYNVTSPITLSNNTLFTGSGTANFNFSGAISGGGSLSKSGSSTLRLGGANSYSGGTILSAGTLQLFSSGTLGSTSGSLAINGGTLDLDGTSQTVGALSGSGGQVNNSSSTASTLTVGNGGGSGSYAGSITNIGSIALTKVGTGTETLTNNNSFTGQTTVSGGTLKLANTSGVALAGGGDVVVNKGGTLLMGANNQINQAVFPAIKLGSTTGTGIAKFDAGGFKQGTGGTPAVPGSGSIGLGALTLNSSAVIDLSSISVLHFSDSHLNTWTGTLSIWDWNGTPVTGGGAEQILFGSNATGLSVGQLLQVSFYSDQGTTLLSNSALILADGEIIPGAPVPEPCTWFAAGLAFLAIGYTQRRKLVPALKRFAALPPG